MSLRIRWLGATPIISTVALAMLLGVAGCSSTAQQASGNEPPTRPR
jgi:type IV pilus biogenesis protein CpaD/CtpE